MLLRPCRFGLIWLAYICPFVVGCNRNDVDVLTRVGTKLAERTETLIEKSPKLHSPLQTKTTRKDRVLQRFQGDKTLADVAIEVVETERGVRLLGTVASERIKAIALELARNTVDVDEVEDGLEVFGE